MVQSPNSVSRPWTTPVHLYQTHHPKLSSPITTCSETVTSAVSPFETHSCLFSPDRVSPLQQVRVQHYTEISPDTLPTTSCALWGAILLLAPGSFTDKTPALPIIAACPQTALIDDNAELSGRCASGMDSMAKGRGEWEERIDEIMQILSSFCVKCVHHFIGILIRFFFA